MGSNSILVIFIFSSLALLVLSSVAEPVNLLPQETPSYKIREGHGKQFGNQCHYRASVTTAASSKVTTGNLTIKFGDSNGNQVYKQKFITFNPQLFITIFWYGPCMESSICYLFLRVNNADGWTPTGITLYSNYERRIPSITYTYVGDEHALNDEWYGVNQCGCHHAAAKAADGTDRISEM